MIQGLFFLRELYFPFYERKVNKMFKQRLMSDEDKCKVADMCGNIVLWILEGRSLYYMAEQLNLNPCEVQHNIDELLYILRKEVGIKRFIRTLFYK